jgi:hypothetical protein
MPTRILTIALAMLIASPALANWVKTPGGATTTGVSPGASNLAFYDFADTTDSPPLNTSRCTTFDVFFDPDEDGTNTGATVFILGSHEPLAALSTATTWKILTDQDGGGLDNNALTGSDTGGLVAIYSAAAPWVYVDVQANAGADDARVVVKCNG